MIGSPAVVPQALNLLLATTLRVDEIFEEVSKDPAYTAFKKLVRMADPAGDLIYVTYSEPLAAMPEWQGPRHMSEVQFRFYQRTVRRFATAMRVDVDDIKADSGTPAKMLAYQDTVRRLWDSALLVWPKMVVDAIKNGVTTVWTPDGQKIFDLHPISPSNASGAKFRNYFSKTVQGGSAAYPITYANELALLKNGYQFKLPSGDDMPIRYNKVTCSPGNVPLLSRLLKDEWIPSYEAAADASPAVRGGSVANEIRNHYDGMNIEVVGMANMPSNLRMYEDTSRPMEIPLVLKERQPITWQYKAPGGPSGAFPVGDDEGFVGDETFDENAATFGPKARGECWFGNWWRAALADSTP
jgi:hypothetical protein